MIYADGERHTGHVLITPETMTGDSFVFASRHSRIHERQKAWLHFSNRPYVPGASSKQMIQGSIGGGVGARRLELKLVFELDEGCGECLGWNEGLALCSGKEKGDTEDEDAPGEDD